VRVRFVDRLVYWAARIAFAVTAHIPQWLGYGFARGLGRLFFRLDGRRRGYALRFLRNAYPDLPEQELLRIGAASTANLFCVPLDMARLTRLLARGGDLREVVDYSPAQGILDMKPPFLAVTAHLGNWEVAAVTMAQHWQPGHGIARVSKNPLLQQWILNNRERGGLHIHPRRGGIRGLAKALETGGIGLQVVDQNQRLRGVFAPVFGEIASCERAAVSLALRRGYPIIVGGTLRVGRGFRFRLVVCEPFVLQRTGHKPTDVYHGVVQMNQRLEELIRQAPEQYLWIHDRYRTQPPPGFDPLAHAADEGNADDAFADADDEV
jgi:Kdo2-lipid IVA lauroyltransferase/acyltransferase